MTEQLAIDDTGDGMFHRCIMKTLSCVGGVGGLTQILLGKPTEQNWNTQHARSPS